MSLAHAHAFTVRTFSEGLTGANRGAGDVASAKVTVLTGANACENYTRTESRKTNGRVISGIDGNAERSEGKWGPTVLFHTRHFRFRLKAVSALAPRHCRPQENMRLLPPRPWQPSADSLAGLGD